MKIINEYTKRKQREKNIARLKFSLLWLARIIVILFLSVVTVYFMGMKMTVYNDAMDPTILKGNQVLINKLTYVISSPKRGDLIIFNPRGNKMSSYEIRRVIGIPGDKISCHSGNLYVNNEKVFLNLPKIKNPGILKDDIKLTGDNYLVISDNRNNMQDSRNPNIGFVRKPYIIGKPWFVLSANNRGFISIKSNN